eukprot:4590629-Amphidinium_carterae.1
MATAAEVVKSPAADGVPTDAAEELSAKPLEDVSEGGGAKRVPPLAVEAGPETGIKRTSMDAEL